MDDTGVGLVRASGLAREKRGGIRIEVKSDVWMLAQNRSGSHRTDFTFQSGLHGGGFPRIWRDDDDFLRFEHLPNGH